MQIRILITDNDLKNKFHKSLEITGQAKIIFADANHLVEFDPCQKIQLRVIDGWFYLNAIKFSQMSKINFKSSKLITLINLKRLFQGHNKEPEYCGEFELIMVNNQFKLIQVVDLEKYVLGAIQAELPADFAIEAMKAQAIACRTYALNPRISHLSDNANVCDSYFCCLYYCGHNDLNKNYQISVLSTKNKIISYAHKPILAIFSSCAGGVTNNFADCFSDPVTGKFPSESIPYLKSVPEGNINEGYFKLQNSKALKFLYFNKKVNTYDANLIQYKWSIQFTANELENQIHVNVQEMLANETEQLFIQAPKHKCFGHIQEIKVKRFGESFVAMELAILTSTGLWVIEKEFLIRKLFKNCKPKFNLLKSGKIFFKHEYDKLGLLTQLTIFGLGLGHGVGLQQVGANAMALQHKNFTEILNHYYCNTQLTDLNNII